MSGIASTLNNSIPTPQKGRGGEKSQPVNEKSAAPLSPVHKQNPLYYFNTQTLTGINNKKKAPGTAWLYVPFELLQGPVYLVIVL